MKAKEWVWSGRSVLRVLTACQDAVSGRADQEGAGVVLAIAITARAVERRILRVVRVRAGERSVHVEEEDMVCSGGQQGREKE